MSYRAIHPRARQQARAFMHLMVEVLPVTWLDQFAEAELDFELRLAGFDVKVHREGWTGFKLLAETRKRAERCYQAELKQDHHTPEDWAFFRFRLEIAYLRTIGAGEDLIQHCYAWHDLTAGFAARIGTHGQDRQLRPC